MKIIFCLFLAIISFEMPASVVTLSEKELDHKINGGIIYKDNWVAHSFNVKGKEYVLEITDGDGITGDISLCQSPKYSIDRNGFHYVRSCGKHAGNYLSLERARHFIELLKFGDWFSFTVKIHVADDKATTINFGDYKESFKHTIIKIEHQK